MIYLRVLYIYMRYKGKFRPQNREKYKGNPSNIIYRSGWELDFMKYLDRQPGVLQWNSEEIIIPYKSPIDGKWHRYYPDFYIKVLEKSGRFAKYIVEIKPKKQTKPPVNKDKRTKSYRNATLTFMKNSAKWKAAKGYCDDRQMKFLILTEDHLAV